MNQSFLALGAIIILALTSLRFNSTILNNTTVEVENKVSLTAFSLADDMIEVIKEKSFDETTIQFPTTNINSLTPVASLGPETGETIDTFDDVDDFNGYSKLISAPHAEDYTISCKIEYVDGDDPDEVNSSPTFDKKATITVTSPYLRYPLSLSYIFTLK